jgi:hypothetical protein
MAYSEGNVDKKVGKYVGYSWALSNDATSKAVDSLVDIRAGDAASGC